MFFTRLVACVWFACFASVSLAANNVVEITYDAAGNLKTISRLQTTPLSISSFTPTSGAVGAAVTIYGTGFSATPANNLVKYNGTTATVSASDAGSISTTVPSGATTGRITVTVGGNTATSSQDFTVVVPGAPTIASFTPTYGTSGASISVTGTGFNTAGGATTVRLNGVVASATVASTTSLSFTVPASTSSGRITATTSVGTGTSGTDFVVPPAGVSGADIITVLRLVAGAPAESFAVGTANKRGMLIFDGTLDGYYTLQFGQLAVTPTTRWADYSVIKPDNTVLATGRIGPGYGATILLPKLPATGTYSVLLSPGIATISANVKLVADPAVTIDGATVAFTMDTPLQNVRATFTATAAQRIGMGVGGNVQTPSANLPFAVYKPDGTALAGNFPSCGTPSGSNTAGNCDLEILTTVAGVYTIVASPSAAGSFDLRLSSDVTGTLVTDVGQDFATTRIGQDARLAFTAAVNDSVAFDVSGIVQTGQAQTVNAHVFKPDGTSMSYVSASPGSNGYFELGQLATAGTYAVLLDATFGAYGTHHTVLKQGPMLATTDSPSAFSTSVIAESVRARFVATAGQNLAVAAGSLTYTAGSGASTLNVYRPNGTSLATASCNPTVAGGACKVTLDAVPAGTYSVAMVPATGVKMSGTFVVSDDITGTLTAGAAQSPGPSRAGQNARYTFSGTAGDSVAVKLYGITTTPANANVAITVKRPDGVVLATTTASSSSTAIHNFGSLPSTGSYTVLVSPSQGVVWQGTVMLDAGTLVTVDGSQPTLTSGTGEPLRYRFSGTSGNRLDLGINGFAYSTGSGATDLTVYKPDGTSLAPASSCSTTGAAGCEWSSASLPVSGTYSVVLKPPATSAISAGTLAISTPLAGTFVVGNPAQTVAITRPGQTARYTFSGTSGQLLRLNWSSVTVSNSFSVAVTVLKPDGNPLSSSSFVNAANGGMDIASLPSTGTYTVVLDPATYAATMSASIALVTR